eukprot:1424919-Amphidinium_carterae.1
MSLLYGSLLFRLARTPFIWLCDKCWAGRFSCLCFAKVSDSARGVKPFARLITGGKDEMLGLSSDLSLIHI